jgi:hypothetical protein
MSRTTYGTKTTKSALGLARAAVAAAKRTLPAYSHSNSPKSFTQHQLFALLVLKQFFKIDYRGLMVRVGEWRELKDVLGLDRVPHWTTIQKAHARLLKNTPTSSN